ncbi:flagellar hook-basal body protein [Fretibacter rubidus]|uniref:flagellar hook-basal body protein n=1 Tax=Fretibacter rubidus TaxID=570162 RepID=UPI00352A4925
MNGAFYIGGIGLSSQQRALDVIANNISNMNTQGFKRSDVSFSEIIAGRTSSTSAAANLQFNPNVAGVSTQVNFSLSEQGEIQTTNRPLDIAINGDGFIELMGPRGESYLWRGGSLSVNDDGMLMADNGMVLRSQINIPLDARAIAIDNEGLVMAQTDGETDAVEIGQIMMVRLQNSQDIERMDGGLYKLNDDANLIDTMAGEDGAGSFVQGAIERSNVDLNNEMVQMMIVQRAYSANAQIVQAGDQMMAIANNLRR